MTDDQGFSDVSWRNKQGKLITSGITSGFTFGLTSGISVVNIY